MTHIKNDKYEIHFNGESFTAITKEHTKSGFLTASYAVLYIENYIANTY